ncbi:MAG: hypothetical protein GY695_15080, partial [Aestuariibacter sp.]|nr:hypothetical protein [Aestuariibacter sp.]
NDNKPITNKSQQQASKANPLPTAYETKNYCAAASLVYSPSYKQSQSPSNGTASNGTASNCTASNGAASNGTASNGTASTGTASNGTASNGTASNGTASNCTASDNNDTSTLVTATLPTTFIAYISLNINPITIHKSTDIKQPFINDNKPITNKSQQQASKANPLPTAYETKNYCAAASLVYSPSYKQSQS